MYFLLLQYVCFFFSFKKLLILIKYEKKIHNHEVFYGVFQLWEVLLNTYHNSDQKSSLESGGTYSSNKDDFPVIRTGEQTQLNHLKGLYYQQSHYFIRKYEISYQNITAHTRYHYLIIVKNSIPGPFPRLKKKKLVVGNDVELH